MSIITQGFGVTNEGIITQGYGIGIQEIVVEAIESVTRRRVIGSSFGRTPSNAIISKRKNYIDDNEKYEEYTIFASISSSNNKNLSIPISNEIKKRIKNFDINITVENIEVVINKKEIEVRVALSSLSQAQKSKFIKIDAKI
jgi:hypothetical protein